MAVNTYHPDKLPPDEGGDELLQLMLSVDPLTKRVPPGVRAIVAAAVAAERERCAKLVETQNPNGDYGVKGWFDLLAAKIRAADKAD